MAPPYRPPRSTTWQAGPRLPPHLMSLPFLRWSVARTADRSPLSRHNVGPPLPRRAQSRAPWRRRTIALAVLAGGWLAGCRDAPTTPSSVRPDATPGVLRADQAPAAANGGAQYGPVTVPVGNPLNPDGYARIASLPTDRYTMLTLRVEGTSALEPTPAYTAGVPLTSGPRGRYSSYSCYWGVDVFLDSARNNTPPSSFRCGSAEDTRPVEATLVTRGVMYARRQPGISACGPTRNQPCYSASGDYTVSAWAPRAALSLSASRSGSAAAVSAGDYYNFTAVITPDQIAGQGVPRYVQSWQFIEDSTGRVVTPSCYSTTCGFGVQRSGRMRVTAWVNAESLTAEFPVKLGPVGLTLEPSRTSVTAGDSVTFTPRPTPADSGSMEVLTWSWQPDSGAASATCSTSRRCSIAIPRSGTMTVQARVQGTIRTATARVTIIPPSLRLTVDRTSSFPGDTFTFSGDLQPKTASGNNVPHRVVAWRFTPGTGTTVTGVAFRASPTSQFNTRAKSVSGHTLSTQRSSTTQNVADVIDSTAVDSMTSVHESGDDLLPPPPDDFPPTQPCGPEVGLVCKMPVHQDGTVTLVVQVGDAQYEASAPVAIRLECPPFIPVDYVLDPGVISFTSKYPVTWRRGAIPPITVEAQGPFRIESDEIRSRDGSPPRAFYEVRSARIVDMQGDIPRFWQMKAGGTIQFWCRTWVERDGKYRGKVQYSGHHRLQWVRGP